MINLERTHHFVQEIWISWTTNWRLINLNVQIHVSKRLDCEIFCANFKCLLSFYDVFFQIFRVEVRWALNVDNASVSWWLWVKIWSARVQTSLGNHCSLGPHRHKTFNGNFFYLHFLHNRCFFLDLLKNFDWWRLINFWLLHNFLDWGLFRFTIGWCLMSSTKWRLAPCWEFLMRRLQCHCLIKIKRLWLSFLDNFLGRWNFVDEFLLSLELVLFGFAIQLRVWSTERNVW